MLISLILSISAIAENDSLYMYACMYTVFTLYVHVPVYPNVYVHVYVWMHAFMYVCMYVCTLSLFVCTCACIMYVKYKYINGLGMYM